MKKLTCTLWVAVCTMVAMSSMIVNPPVVVFKGNFVIKNLTSNDTIKVELKDFSLGKRTVNFSKGVYEGDELEISYNPPPLLSSFTYQVAWTYGWGNPSTEKGTGLTEKFRVQNAPYISPTLNIFAVACTSSIKERSELIEGQSEDLEIYTMEFPNVQRGRRVTVKNIDASEVQVVYADYEKVASAGQRASVSLYDIYGNLVSTGYLDALGMSTLSTKGKPGYYIVKVMVGNRVIFTETIQVK